MLLMETRRRLGEGFVLSAKSEAFSLAPNIPSDDSSPKCIMFNGRLASSNSTSLTRQTRKAISGHLSQHLRSSRLIIAG